MVVSSSKCPEIRSSQIGLGGGVGWGTLCRSSFFCPGEELSFLVLCPRNRAYSGLLRFGELSGFCLASLTIGHGLETLSRQLVSWDDLGVRDLVLFLSKITAQGFLKFFSWISFHVSWFREGWWSMSLCPLRPGTHFQLLTFNLKCGMLIQESHFSTNTFTEDFKILILHAETVIAFNLTYRYG